MAIVTGVVGWCGKNKYGKYSLKLDDNETWYSSQYEINCSKGDNVEFDNGGKKYVNKLKVTTSGGGASYTQPVNPSAPTGTLSQRDRCIVRQNALTNARSAFDPLQLTSEYDAETYAQSVIDLAKEFESYTSGDFELIAANAPQPASEFLD